MPLPSFRGLVASDRLSVSVHPDLDEDRRVIVLDTAGQSPVVMTPAGAARVGLSAQSPLEFMQRLHLIDAVAACQQILYGAVAPAAQLRRVLQMAS